MSRQLEEFQWIFHEKCDNDIKSKKKGALKAKTEQKQNNGDKKAKGKNKCIIE